MTVVSNGKGLPAFVDWSGVTDGEGRIAIPVAGTLQPVIVLRADGYVQQVLGSGLGVPGAVTMYRPTVVRGVVTDAHTGAAVDVKGMKVYRGWVQGSPRPGVVGGIADCVGGSFLQIRGQAVGGRCCAWLRRGMRQQSRPFWNRARRRWRFG